MSLKTEKAIILQPSYMPGLSYFSQLVESDVFIINDNIPFFARDWKIRHKIRRTEKDIMWLTVPTKDYKDKLVNEVEIDYSEHWVDSHLKLIKQSYGKSKYFDLYYNDIKTLLLKPYTKLIDLDMELIDFFCSKLGMKLYFVLASELKVPDNLDRSMRLVHFIDKVKCSKILLNYSLKDDIDLLPLEKCKVMVCWYEFKHPRYKQMYNKFVPNLSILDLLFNKGNDSIKYIKGRNKYGAKK